MYARPRLEPLESRDPASVLLGTSWPQPGGQGSPLTLTYSTGNLTDGGLGGGLSPAAVRAAVGEALSLWAAVAPIHFVEVPDSGPMPPSLDDYDGAGHALIRLGHVPIDGSGGSIGALGVQPGTSGLSGDVFLDSDEQWSLAETGAPLLQTLTHEIGHTLGLDHEDAVPAVMRSVLVRLFSSLGSGRLLADDISGIRSIYGLGTGSVSPLVAAPPVPAVSALAASPPDAFAGFLGRVDVAVGDVTGDGVQDAVFVAQGQQGHTKVFDGRTGALTVSLLAFPGFAGGTVALAAGNGVVAVAAQQAQGHLVSVGAASGEAHSLLAFPGYRGTVALAVVESRITIQALGAGHVATFDAELNLLSSRLTGGGS